jgi:hypothetical protein
VDTLPLNRQIRNGNAIVFVELADANSDWDQIIAESTP